MLRIVKRPGSPFWYVRGTFAGRAVFASTKERDKADARRFKESLEVELARTAGQKHHAATFQDGASLYLEARRTGDQWQANIERLCAVIGDRLLVDIRQHVLVDAANALYPGSKPSSKNCAVFAPAAAVMHYAAENDLCPYLKAKKLKAKKPEPRAMRKKDAARLIAAADGKMKLLLVFLFTQGWRIGDALRLQWADIDLGGSTVWYRISKTDEAMPMPLHVLTLDMLRAEPRPHIGRVFPWRARRALYRRLKPLCDRASRRTWRGIVLRLGSPPRALRPSKSCGLARGVICDQLRVTPALTLGRCGRPSTKSGFNPCNVVQLTAKPQ